MRAHYNFSLSILIPNPHRPRFLHLSRDVRAKFRPKSRVLSLRINPLCRLGASSFRCFSRTRTQIHNSSLIDQTERPPFDINLAGFAFEAYTTPPEIFGKREVDAAGCTTVYLSESFIRERYMMVNYS